MDIYHQLKREILRGQFHFGERVREKDIAERYNLSRTPVREAIRKLASDGLVVLSPNKGATVRTYSKEDIINIYNVRAVIEGYTCMETIRHKTADGMRLLEESVNKSMEALEEYKYGNKEEAIFQHIEANQQFHQTISAMSGNIEIPKVLASISTLPIMFHGYYWFSNKGVEDSVQHHRDILEAFKREDAFQAKALMEIHIYHGRDKVIHNFENFMNGKTEKANIQLQSI